jgi:hypothetical protein
VSVGSPHIKIDAWISVMTVGSNFKRRDELLSPMARDCTNITTEPGSMAWL